VKVPFGYGTERRELADVEDWLLEHHHPEYVRRLVAWLESKDGLIGVGGGWRDDGSQPDKPGFAPEGKSFHQNQRFADGFIGAAAVDVVKASSAAGGVHITVTWGDVPNQGSPDAVCWGVHANVNAGPTPEPWHIQPVEIDGWDRWMDAGCPPPVADYPISGSEEDVTDAEIERIADAVWARVMTFTPTNKQISAETMLEYSAAYACTAQQGVARIEESLK
jgi:hypothetical protein